MTLFVARPLLTPVAQKLCKCERGVFASRTVSILEHYFASKSFAAVREAVSNAYPDKEVPNKTTIHRHVSAFRNTGSVCVSLGRWWTSAVKLFCKFFRTKTKTITCLVILMSPKLTNTVVVTVAFKWNILYRRVTYLSLVFVKIHK
jgi:hypothetical protein